MDDAARLSRARFLLGAALGLAALASLPLAAAVSFDDAAVEEGLLFFRAGDRDNDSPSFIEIMGGGACWFDYDNDGLLDVYLVNGWLNDTGQAEQQRPHSSLFRNLGPQAGPDFVEVSLAAGVAEQGWTQGCSAADYDADGWEDLLVVGRGIQSLYRNQGDGTFRNASAEAGVTAEGKCPDQPCWGASAAWADYDRDGCLDLYVINFVEFDMAEGGANRGPGGHDGQPSQLYRSNCDGTFTDVTAQSGADGAPGPEHSKNWGVSWLDYDLDGWLDIYIASDGVPNILLRNNANGTFTDVAEEAGVDDARNSMGLATGDCDEDGDEELFFTHYKSVQELPWWGWDGFWVNNANGTFTDKSGQPDLNVTEPYVKWGVGWEDFDNDGDQDIHVVTGHTENAVADADMPPLFWLGDGQCGWSDARADAGPAMLLERMSRGSSYADYDLDGDVDAVVVNIMGEPSMLLRNSGSTNHWLSVELRQPGGNPRGIGAQFNVTLPDGQVLHRRMMPSQSIHGSNAAQVHVGLGSHASADVAVRWPDTWEEQRFEGLKADQLVRLHRDGTVQNDTVAPRSWLEVQGTRGEPGWWRSQVMVELRAEDRGVGWPSGVLHRFMALDGGPEQQDPGPMGLGEGLHALRVRSTDAAGNREPARTELVGVDTGLPASQATLQGPLEGGWYRGPVRVTLTCADAVSGVGRVEWRLDLGAWVRYEGPFDLTRPGEHAFAWRCVDVAGNEEPEHSVPLAIDLGHPETLAVLSGLAGNTGWWRSAVQVALDAAGGLHPVVQTWVALDGGQPEPYAGPFTLAGDGAHTLLFWSEDAAGRVEPGRSQQVSIDASPPALALRAQSKHVDADWALLVGPRNKVLPEALDATSGLARFEARQDEGPWRAAGKPLRFSGEGRHLALLRAWDLAGNEASFRRDVYLDLTPPPVGIVLPQDQTVMVQDMLVLPLLVNPSTARAVLVGAAPLEAEAGPDISGVDSVRFLVQGQPVAVVREPPWRWVWSLPPTAGVFFTVHYTAEDGVGNVRGVSFSVWATGVLDPLLPPFPVAPPEPLAGPGPPGLPPRDEPLLAAPARLSFEANLFDRARGGSRRG